MKKKQADDFCMELNPDMKYVVPCAFITVKIGKEHHVEYLPLKTVIKDEELLEPKGISIV